MKNKNILSSYLKDLKTPIIESREDYNGFKQQKSSLEL